MRSYQEKSRCRACRAHATCNMQHATDNRLRIDDEIAGTGLATVHIVLCKSPGIICQMADAAVELEDGRKRSEGSAISIAGRHSTWIWLRSPRLFTCFRCLTYRVLCSTYLHTANPSITRGLIYIGRLVKSVQDIFLDRSARITPLVHNYPPTELTSRFIRKNELPTCTYPPTHRGKYKSLSRLARTT